ncbi:MAG: hypothetical protein WBW54_02560, partial [Candidatus Acidiferrales bacterium]
MKRACTVSKKFRNLKARQGCESLKESEPHLTHRGQRWIRHRADKKINFPKKLSTPRSPSESP